MIQYDRAHQIVQELRFEFDSMTVSDAMQMMSHAIAPQRYLRKINSLQTAEEKAADHRLLLLQYYVDLLSASAPQTVVNSDGSATTLTR